MRFMRRGFMGSGQFVFAPGISGLQNTYDLRAQAVAAGWDQVRPLNATLTITATGSLYSSSTTPALTVSGSFPTYSKLTINNAGVIYGKAGTGGAGGTYTGTVTGQAGGNGGNAINATVAITINNTGTIAGGGGGGGGGGSGHSNTATYEGGGGGGGGAATFPGLTGGAGGVGGSNAGLGSTTPTAPSGTAGTTAIGTGGSGGLGLTSGGATNAAGGVGGNGGLPGSPGTAGQAGQIGDAVYGGGAAGTAGYFVTGGGTITWGASGTTLGLGTAPPAPPPAPAPSPPAGDGLPTRVLGLYFETYLYPYALSITDVPLDFNVIYLFGTHPDGPLIRFGPGPYDFTHDNTDNGTTPGAYVMPDINGPHITPAKVQAVRARGQKVLLTIGGSAAGYVYDTRTKSTNLLNSIKSMYVTLGGFDGVDFNCYEGNLCPLGSATLMGNELSWVVGQLRTLYGSTFACTTPPAPDGVGRPSDRLICKALYDNGCLSMVAPQYYDNPTFNPTTVKSWTDQWVTYIGDQTKVGVGLPSGNYHTANPDPIDGSTAADGMTLQQDVDTMTLILAAYPNIRGVFCWAARYEIGGGNVFGPTIANQLGIGAASATYPVPSNNKYVLIGDSRFANATQNSNTTGTLRLSADGPAPYIETASENRGYFAGNYAINGLTIQNTIDRLAVVDGTRDNLLAATPGSSAGIAIVLIGCNDTTSPISVTGPKYTSLCQQLVDAGKVVILCNELPTNRTDTALQPQLDRRAYLDALTLTGANAGKLVKLNTFDLVLKPGTTNISAIGTYLLNNGATPPGPALHPGPVGIRIVGEAIGTLLKNILANVGTTYPKRNAALTLASQSVVPDSMMAGTAGTSNFGTNKNGQNATCFSGSIATNWNLDRGDRLTTLLETNAQGGADTLQVVASKGVDPGGFTTQIFHVTGNLGSGRAYQDHYIELNHNTYVTAANFASGNVGAGMNGIASVDGDSFRAIAHVRVNADAKGLLGAGVELVIASTTYPQAGLATLSGSTTDSIANQIGSNAYDGVVMSPPRTIPAGFCSTVETKTVSIALHISIAADATPIDFTVTVSQFGIVKVGV
jgi:chitinase